MELPCVSPAATPTTSTSKSGLLISNSPNFPGVMAQVQNQAEIIAFSFVFVLSIFCNGLVFWLFWKRPAMRTPSNRFVLNLSLAHFLQALFVMPTVVVTYTLESWRFGNFWCQVTGSLTICLNVATVLAILLIAFDRGVAVNNPLHYNTTITKHRASILIVILWCVATACALPPLFGMPKIAFLAEWGSCYVAWSSGTLVEIVYGSMLSMMGFFAPLVVITSIYMTMFHAARMNTARRRKHSVASCLSDVTVCLEPKKKEALHSLFEALRRHKKPEQKSPKHLFWRECKAARTGLLVVGTLIFCWLPFFLSILIELHYLIPDSMRFFVTFATFCGCVINPYIYIFRNKTFRSHVKKLFECHRDLRNCYFDCGKSDRIKRESVRHIARDVSVSSSYVARIVNPKNALVPTIPNSSPRTDKNENVQDTSVINRLFEGNSLLSSDFNSDPGKVKVFSLPSVHEFLHQDSISSNDSTDAGIVSVLGSVSENTTQWYTQFKHKANSRSLSCSSVQSACSSEIERTDTSANYKTILKTFLRLHNLPSEKV